MSSFDPELLQRLAAADAAVPPPPGAPLTPDRLQAHAARRRRERALAVAAAVLLVGVPLSLWPAAAHERATLHDATDALDERRAVEADLLAELRALRDRLDAVQQDLRRQRADDERATVREARFELTTVRADAVLAAGAPTKTHPEQPR